MSGFENGGRRWVVALLVAVAAVLVWWSNGPADAPDPSQRAGAAEPAGEPATSATGEAAQRTAETAPAPEPPRADAPSGAIVAGIVVDTSRAPLAGVRVTARPLAADLPVIGEPVRTAADGSFTLRATPATAIELAFAAAGHRPRRLVTVAPQQGLDVVLERSPALRGRVVRADGSAVPGAYARWSSPHLARDSGAATRTDEQGRFAFAAVPSALDLLVLAPRALPYHRYVLPRWDGRELVVTVDDGRLVRGIVTDAASGEGLAGADVALWFYGSTYTAEGRRGGAAQLSEAVVTAADGTFSLRMPNEMPTRATDACLWVQAQGHAPHWRVLAAPAAIERLELALHRSATVRGRVVDASGAPVAGLRVFAEGAAQTLCVAEGNAGYRWQHVARGVATSRRRPEPVAPFHVEREAFTDGDGRYRIERVPCADGGSDVRVSIHGGDPFVTVVAMPGREHDAPDLVREDDGWRRLRGVVRGDDDRPVAGATVTLGWTRTVGDADGRFTLAVPKKPPATRLRASASGYVAHDGVVDELQQDVTITLLRGHLLPVEVVDRNGHPVADATVYAFADGVLRDRTGGSRSGHVCRARTDGRGVALLDGVPATCDLLVEAANPGRRAKQTVHGVAARDRHRVVVRLDDLDLSAGRVRLTVRIQDERSGDPFVGPVRVEASSPANPSDGALVRAARGPEVVLDGLVPGEWQLVVGAEGFGQRTRTVRMRIDTRVDVGLGAGPTITGRVTCEDGAMPAAVQVLARELSSGTQHATRTDAAGGFVLHGMTAGRYELTVPPFESELFRFWPMRAPQTHASPGPVRVDVDPAAAVEPVTLPVVAVRSLRVVVADGASRSGSLQFTVSDASGASIYAGGPSDVFGTNAELELRVPAGDYRITVRDQGMLVAERTLPGGNTWQVR